MRLTVAGHRAIGGQSARREHSGRTDRGTALLLFPAGFLVILVLAAIAVDLSTTQLAQRELRRTLEVATDDAAAMLDDDAVRATDRLTLDADAAERVVRFEVATAHLPGPIVAGPTVVVDRDAGIVTATASIEVHPMFGPIVGGGPQTITVRAQGRLVEGR